MMPESRICLVDLGKTLLFQAFYCQTAHPHRSHGLMENGSVPSDTRLDFLYCPAEHLEKLNGFSFDAAINIASMQEMNQLAIQEYFSFLRSHMPAKNLFYCCNREEKKMPGDEVSRFSSYPWHEKDIHLLDGNCPWHEYFLSFRPTASGARFLNFRIPLINYFDGPHRHRLSVFHCTSHSRS